MPDHPIGRILHISDLHFGDRLENREIWRHTLLAHTPIQGLYNHDYQAVRALQRIVHEIATETKTAAVPLLIVHTGDLTAGGKQAEFQTGETFLHSLTGEITLFRLDSNKLRPDARGEVSASALDLLCGHSLNTSLNPTTQRTALPDPPPRWAAQRAFS